MARNFTHDGKIFEIRTLMLNGRHSVKVFLDDKQVSPEYSANFEVGHDYFSQHQSKIIDELAILAERDIRNDIFLRD